MSSGTGSTDVRAAQRATSARRVPPSRLRLGFVCEIVLGHATYYRQVLAAAEHFPHIDLVPIPVPYEPSGFLHRVPPLSNWTVRAGYLAHRAVAAAGPVDVLLINTQTAAVGCVDAMRHTPSIISSDATPANYDELAEAYAHRVGTGRIEQVKRKIMTRTYNSAAAVVAWSGWVRDSVEQDYSVPSERIRVIRAGTADRRSAAGPAGPHRPPPGALRRRRLRAQGWPGTPRGDP